MAKRFSYKKQAKTAVKRIKKAPVVAGVLVAFLIVVAGFLAYMYFFQNQTFMYYYNMLFGLPTTATVDTWDTEPYVPTNNVISVEGEELSIHFLELGNEYAGDCVYIKAGETDMLVDAGSRKNSLPTIKAYLDNYVTDGKLEYVIATHADQDHIAGFASSSGIFSYYQCDTIIDFAKTNKTTETYQDYVKYRNQEVDDGAKHYTALECYSNSNGASRQYSLSSKVTLNFLYQEFYQTQTSDENDYSVCFLLTYENGSEDKHYLFTGDLEEDGEASLVENNVLPKVELFKAGHHGSKTSSTDPLLNVIQPKIVCVCCCAGSVEYTQNLQNTFPTQAFIDRVSKWTDKVYVTTRVNIHIDEKTGKYKNNDDYRLMNGNVVVMTKNGNVRVECSHDNTILKDTPWFKNKRICPLNWK